MFIIEENHFIPDTKRRVYQARPLQGEPEITRE
jgi:hypothetical protein